MGMYVCTCMCDKMFVWVCAYVNLWCLVFALAPVMCVYELNWIELIVRKTEIRICIVCSCVCVCVVLLVWVCMGMCVCVCVVLLVCVCVCSVCVCVCVYVCVVVLFFPFSECSAWFAESFFFFFFFYIHSNLSLRLFHLTWVAKDWKKSRTDFMTDIMKVNPFSHVSNQHVHENLMWKSLEYRYTKHLCTMVYKILNNLTPNYMTENITFKTSDYALRSNQNLNLPKPKTNSCKRKKKLQGSFML